MFYIFLDLSIRYTGSKPQKTHTQYNIYNLLVTCYSPSNTPNYGKLVRTFLPKGSNAISLKFIALFKFRALMTWYNFPEEICVIALTTRHFLQQKIQSFNTWVNRECSNTVKYHLNYASLVIYLLYDCVPTLCAPFLHNNYTFKW